MIRPGGRDCPALGVLARAHSIQSSALARCVPVQVQRKPCRLCTHTHTHASSYTHSLAWRVGCGCRRASSQLTKGSIVLWFMYRANALLCVFVRALHRVYAALHVVPVQPCVREGEAAAGATTHKVLLSWLVCAAPAAGGPLPKGGDQEQCAGAGIIQQQRQPRQRCSCTAGEGLGRWLICR